MTELAEIEFRSAELVEVSFPKRTVELIVMPYETEAENVPYHGHTITEICSRGAYDGVEARTGRVKLNRDHVVERVLGRTIRFDTGRQEGLVAECKIANTPTGEEALELCAEGILEASAGFGLMRKNGRTGPVIPNAETWETRSRRRLNHLYLDHIALVPEAAYEDARVVAVRQRNETVAVAATPNLEAFQLREWQEKLAALDELYTRH